MTPEDCCEPGEIVSDFALYWGPETSILLERVALQGCVWVTARAGPETAHLAVTHFRRVSKGKDPVVVPWVRTHCGLEFQANKVELSPHDFDDEYKCAKCAKRAGGER